MQLKSSGIFGSYFPVLRLHFVVNGIALGVLSLNPGLQKIVVSPFSTEAVLV